VLSSFMARRCVGYTGLVRHVDLINRLSWLAKLAFSGGQMIRARSTRRPLLALPSARVVSASHWSGVAS
jgi:hypothetical protein